MHNLVSDSIRKANYSDHFEILKKDGQDKLSAHLNLSEHELPDNLKSFNYPVSNWPVLINQEAVEELRQLSIRIPFLIRQIPELYFDEDIKALANFYFNGDELMAEFGLICHQKELETACRLDLTLTENGFQVLEVNVGSAIGGWEVQSLEASIRQLHPLLSNTETAANYHAENTLTNYFKFLVDKIQSQVDTETKEVNVFMAGLSHIPDEAFKKNNLDFFNTLLNEELEKRGMKGQAYIDDYAQLKLGKRKLMLRDIPIHCVVTLNLNAPPLPPAVTRAFIMEQIYFPDHLGIRMYFDKRNLALLRELAENNKFTPEDNALVLKCIPWTAHVIENAEVNYRGAHLSLNELLKSEKDNFVLKPLNGTQGRDVFIGKYLDDLGWDYAIKEANEKNIFIAQEYTNCLQLNTPNKNNEWVSHKLVWGAFGFGENYGGVWVRMTQADQTNGVINSATGAVDAIVFEQKA